MKDDTKLSDADLALGGYRFEDLQELRVVKNRTDLERKLAQHGFPKPLKTGKAQTLFLKVEVHAWLRQRAAQRDEPKPVEPPVATSPAPVKAIKQQLSPPRRPVGRPRKTPAISPGQ